MTPSDPTSRPASSPGTSWFKSSFSGGACACVEVCSSGDAVLVRDTKDEGRTLAGERPTLRVDAHHWRELCEEIAVLGDNATGFPALQLARTADGFVMTTFGSPHRLVFDQAEIDAFVLGVRAGEFTFEGATVPAV